MKVSLTPAVIAMTCFETRIATMPLSMKRSLLTSCLLPLLFACSHDKQAAASDDPVTGEHFSFFVTSLKAMARLSGNADGFGGDLRFGETGAGAGLRGADKICTTIAEDSMPGNGKTWRAFLSVTEDEGGKPVNALDRVGSGPWYDRAGRLVAQNKADLAQERPDGADEAIIDDLPNEDGIPNHAPDVVAGEVDNHDVLTGTNDKGQLFSTDPGRTCNDWTSAIGEIGQPHCGHSWPRRGGPMDGATGGPGPRNEAGASGADGGGFFTNGEGGTPSTAGPGGGPIMMIVGGDGPTGGPVGMNGSGNNWMSALDEAGCAPGAFVVEAGPPGANHTLTVGDGGGYGAIYCFALTP
jgi:hypothetical protein